MQLAKETWPDMTSWSSHANLTGGIANHADVTGSIGAPLLVTAVHAAVSSTEEPGGEKRHAGICEGAVG